MQVINIPQNTQIFKFYQKNQLFLKIIGPLGQIHVKVPEVLNFLQEKNFLKIKIKKNEKFLKSYKKTFETVFSSHLKISLIIKKKL